MMITQDNLVILKAQVQSDADNGGGLPTNQTVPNNISNALFPDVSDTDRMMGRVRLRKIFLAVQSVNDELIQSARLIFTKIPEKMSVFAFKASAFADRRVNAKDRIESYLARGSRWAGHLLESHLRGQRVIQLSLDPNDSVPSVGSSLVLVQNENQADEYYQFVRVAKVSTHTRKFQIDKDKSATRLVATIEITDSLQRDFTGMSVRNFYDGVSEKRFAIVRETIVADAAQYYSASHLAKPISAMTTQTVNLDSIYVQVVPSTQVETPLVQNNPSMNSVFFVKGNDEKVSQTLTTSETNQLGAVYPTSLAVTIGGTTYHDENGEIKNGNITIGTIAYETGVISWYQDYVGRMARINFTPSGHQVGANATEVIRVPKIGAGYNYVHTLAHEPLPLSVKVSYQSNGEVYTLSDVGGKLTGQGSGVVNNSTVVITTQAIPDSESLIIISYGTDNGAVNVGGMQKRLYTKVDTDWLPDIIDGASIWQMTDDGLKVYFDKLPLKGSTITLRQKKVNIEDEEAKITHHQATDGNGATVSKTGSGLNIVTEQTINPRSLKIQVNGCSFCDDGRGNIIFLRGFEKVLSDSSKRASGSTSSVSGFGRVNGIAYGNYSSSGNTSQQATSTTVYTENRSGEIMGIVNYDDGTISITKPLQLLLKTTSNYNASSSKQIGTHANSSEGASSSGNSNQRQELRLNGEGLLLAYSSKPKIDINTINAINTQNELKDINIVTVPVIHLYADFDIDVLDSSIRLKVGDWVYVGANLTHNNVSKGVFGRTIQLNDWQENAVPFADFQSGVVYTKNNSVGSLTFRSAVRPLQTGSVQIMGRFVNGENFTLTTTQDGQITGSDKAHGTVDFKNGVIDLVFYEKMLAESSKDEWWYDERNIYEERYIDKPHYIDPNSVTMNAVGYAYLPLDSNIIGLDPVRLPTDGRVPFIRKGDGLAITELKSMTVTNPTNRIELGEVRLSDVRVYNSKGDVKAVVDLDRGVVTFDEMPTFPVTVDYRIMDMGLIVDSSITGMVTLANKITHDYTTNAVASSMLLCGDLQAKYFNVFSQKTWGREFSDSLIGERAESQLQDSTYPIIVTNDSAITERWALVFRSNTAFSLIGESVGEIAQGTVNADFAPLNPVTAKPYFTINQQAFGVGWDAGNVIRFNTEGASFPVWVGNAIPQHTAGVDDEYKFCMSYQVNVNRS